MTRTTIGLKSCTVSKLSVEIQQKIVYGFGVHLFHLLVLQQYSLAVKYTDY